MYFIYINLLTDNWKGRMNAFDNEIDCGFLVIKQAESSWVINVKSVDRDLSRVIVTLSISKSDSWKHLWGVDL